MSEEPVKVNGRKISEGPLADALRKRETPNLVNAVGVQPIVEAAYRQGAAGLPLYLESDK